MASISTRTLATACLCIVVLAPAPTAQHASTALGPRPAGLMAVIKSGWALDPRTFDNPSIVGVALQIHWDEIEPNEGTPDWTRLDAFVSNAAAAHKWVQVCVYAGFFTPPWALEGVKTDRFPIQYGPEAGRIAALPMPWDTVYLGRWLAFLKALSERYGSSSTVRIIGVTGPTSVSDEATLPQSPADLKQWQADGYTPSKYLSGWKRVLTAYAADFPGQYLSIAGMGGGLSIDETGKIDRAAQRAARQALADQAVAILGERFALEDNNLDGTTKPDPPCCIALVMSYIGKAVTGFQLRTSAAGPGMGAAGATPAVKLRDAIDKGMRPNQAGQHVDFLQIYQPDILKADLQPVLRYGASLFAPKPSRLPALLNRILKDAGLTNPKEKKS